jgi:nickel/cobalt exporter
MKPIAGRIGALAALFSALLAAPGIALAASSPFGIATPDGSGSVAWAGPFKGFFIWVAAQQASFYKELTAALHQVSDSGHAAWFLVAISFAYGVFHAVGPGHGKAVISSYLLASGDTLKRGVAISFASAFVQAVTAIVVVSVGTLLLNVTAVTMTRATDALEVASYALIALCGVWLLWSRLRPASAAARAAMAPHVHDAHCVHNLTFSVGNGGAAMARASSFSCDCGHAHMPDPSLLTAPLTLRNAAAAVMAVGIRPCSGAIIVLVFAISQKLYWGGILSVLAMAVGTGLTVAALATLAVKAKDVALRFSADGSTGRLAVLRGLELAASAGILLFGIIMLGGALAAG